MPDTAQRPATDDWLRRRQTNDEIVAKAIANLKRDFARIFRTRDEGERG